MSYRSGEEAVVQRLDVEQLGLELQAAQVDPALEDGVERERVVGTRREAEPELHATASRTRARAAARASAIRHPAWFRSPARFGRSADDREAGRRKGRLRPLRRTPPSPRRGRSGAAPLARLRPAGVPAASATERSSTSAPPRPITSASAKPSWAGPAPPAPMPSMRTEEASIAAPIANRSGSYVPAAPTRTTPSRRRPGGSRSRAPRRLRLPRARSRTPAQGRAGRRPGARPQLWWGRG